MLAAGAMITGMIDGRQGEDRFKGGDAANSWIINAANAGMFNGKPFKDIENLEGGADEDVFLFAGGSIGSVDGGAGSDTLDYSADTAGVTIDLLTGTASRVGNVANIENVVTGAGSDTIVGALSAVILNTGAGTDTLDFSDIASNLTITVHANGTVSVTDGINTVSGIAGAENIVGGSGPNTYVFEDGASLAGTISGSGATILDYSAYTTGVTVNLANGTATGTAGVSNVVKVVGGSGSDTLVGPDSGATWNITGPGSGSVAGVSFSGIENLSGGSGADAFVFSGGSVAGTVDGGAGSDTLDYSADTLGVTVDLSTGTASYAGNVTGIENVITGVGNDTLIGALAGIILDTGAGTDTLDFSSVPSNLTININVNGTITVTDGLNTVSNISGVENIIGGSGTNTYVFEDGASLAGRIEGSAVLDYSAYTTDVTVNLATGAATGTGGVSNITKIIGGTGNDTLRGPDTSTTWNITGDGTGNVAGVSFSNFENLTGGSSTDTFVFADGADVAGSVDGGAGVDAVDYSDSSTGLSVKIGPDGVANIETT